MNVAQHVELLLSQASRMAPEDARRVLALKPRYLILAGRQEVAEALIEEAAALELLDAADLAPLLADPDPRLREFAIRSIGFFPAPAAPAQDDERWLEDELPS